MVVEIIMKQQQNPRSPEALKDHPTRKTKKWDYIQQVETGRPQKFEGSKNTITI
jgi:hypothetical protein